MTTCWLWLCCCLIECRVGWKDDVDGESLLKTMRSSNGRRGITRRVTWRDCSSDETIEMKEIARMELLFFVVVELVVAAVEVGDADAVGGAEPIGTNRLCEGRALTVGFAFILSSASSAIGVVVSVQRWRSTCECGSKRTAASTKGD